MTDDSIEEDALTLPPAGNLVRGGEATTRAILMAGCRLFAQQGYSHTVLRDVARVAGVNLALINRYFGSKEGLYRAALEHVLPFPSLVEYPREQIGTRVAAAFFDAEDPYGPLAMTALSVGDPAALRIAAEIVRERLVAPIGAYIGGADGEQRARRLMMLWTGFFMGLRLMPEALCDSKGLEQWLAEATQAIVGDFPARA
jgi:AcrR family transcriptional regulator